MHAMKSVTMQVEGVHCAGCAAAIRARLASQPGVIAADVILSDGRVRVLYEPKVGDAQQLIDAVRVLGYRVMDHAVSRMV
jgi:copper chaperone CopZ